MEDKSQQNVSTTTSSRSSPLTSRSNSPNNMKDQRRYYDSWGNVIAEISPLAKSESLALAMRSVDMDQPNEELKNECQSTILKQFEEFKHDLTESLTFRLRDRLQAIEKQKIHSARTYLEKCDKKMRFELACARLLRDDCNQVLSTLEKRKTSLLDERNAHYTDVYSEITSSDLNSELRRSMGVYINKLQKIKRCATADALMNNRVTLEITETNFQSSVSRFEQKADQDRNDLKSYVRAYLKQEVARRDSEIHATYERDTKTLRREIEQLKKMINHKKPHRSAICVIL